MSLDNWDDRAPLCGNCRFWLIEGYQHDWEGCEPCGNPHGESDCRRRAPVKVGAGADSVWGERTAWPRTHKRHWCGEFELRAKSHRMPKP